MNGLLDIDQTAAMRVHSLQPGYRPSFRHLHLTLPIGHFNDILLQENICPWAAARIFQRRLREARWPAFADAVRNSSAAADQGSSLAVLCLDFALYYSGYDNGASYNALLKQLSGNTALVNSLGVKQRIPMRVQCSESAISLWHLDFPHQKCELSVDHFAKETNTGIALQNVACIIALELNYSVPYALATDIWGKYCYAVYLQRTDSKIALYIVEFSNSIKVKYYGAGTLQVCMP